MNEQAVYAMKLTKVYPLLVAKAERKGRTQQEADAVIRWLTPDMTVRALRRSWSGMWTTGPSSGRLPG